MRDFARLRFTQVAELSVTHQDKAGENKQKIARRVEPPSALYHCLHEA